MENSKEVLMDMMEKILDIAQVATPKDHWAATRSKILRYVNDAIRRLEYGDDSDSTNPRAEG